jgi:hypothetical protein
VAKNERELKEMMKNLGKYVKKKNVMKIMVFNKRKEEWTE